uniref:Bromodomain adjacent to zinc finger domain 2A n=1 Tax=Sphenodon punctatus TaxID=8508 RepID=A0A8D0GHR7_SPHPU
METNNHFNFTGLPSSPAASGLKPAPSSGDNVYTNGSTVNIPQQGKSLNGDMNVNGLSTVSHATASGTHSSSAPHLHHSYDYLWNYSQYSPANTNAGNLKDSSLFPQYPLNGIVGSTRQGSPGHNANLRAAPGGGQEFWANGTQASMGLNFDSTELYDSFHDDQNFELLPSTAPAISENGGSSLLGSMELEDTQPDLKMCDYNGSSPAVEPLSREASVLARDAEGSCLQDATQIPTPLEDSDILSESPLEPFESLDRDPGTGDLYEMDTSELVSGKSPLEEAPDISALDCPESLSLNHSSSFSLLADDSQPSASLFAGDSSPPILHESVLQDSSLDLTNESEAGQEDSELLDPSPPTLEPESPLPSLEEEEEEEEAADSIEAPATDAAVGGDSKKTAPLRSSASGDVPRRRIATVEEVCYPLKHGWRREVRIKKGSHRWQGETWYYGPCGKRMKQFPEVIKYLSRNVVQSVRREHFSFSPRMPVGDFYEERDTPEGLQWVKLASEEIPSRIQAITGKRGRPRNTEKAKAKEAPKVKRGRGRPPKVKVAELLSKTDARILKRLEARNKQKQEAKTPKPKEPKKKAKKEKGKPEKPKVKPKVKPKEKKAAAAAAATARVARKGDKNALAQRRLEERQRQQMILEEMKKPTEDMCLGDHQPLPAFSRIPGLILPNQAFSDCLATVEFLHSYGKVLGFDVPREVPSLCTLQEGLFNADDSLGEVLDLLVKLLQAALFDPGLPSYCQSLKILGEKVSEIRLNRDTVSEVLRCFLMVYGADEELCSSLRTKPFQALPPDSKAAVLAFLVNELNGSALIINEIDKTLENMSNYRKNKWIIEGKLRRLKFALAKKLGRPESEISSLDEGRRRRRRSSRITEENGGLQDEEEEESRGRRSRRDEEVMASGVLHTRPCMSPQRQIFFRKKLLLASQMLRAASLGQDRYCRRYWLLPHLGGVFVEGCKGSVSPVKKEPSESPIASHTNCAASRSRGRPRKDRAEPVEWPDPSPINGLLEDSVPLGQSQHDLSQSAFLSWLSQTQQASSLLNSSVLTPDSSPGKGDLAASEPTTEEDSVPERHGAWFNLLPRTPCDDAPLTTSADQPSPKPAPPPCSLPTADQPKASGTPDKPQEPPPKRRGRPPTKLFKQLEQKYFTQLTPQPVPPDMQQGWWWLHSAEELDAVVRALHPRGIREKALHKHFTKHKEYLREVCARTATDSIFQPHSMGPGHPVSQEALARWSVTEWAFETDLSVLQWVEELEQRVLMSDLQIRGWTCPSPDSARDDLQYCEHKVEALEDITIKNRREGPALRREATHPLDLAVLRLAALEQNVERRYLKEPLWALHEVVVEKALLTNPDALELGSTEIAYEITPRIRTWRQTLERCRSAAQVSLCIYQLERSIAWEKSVVKVTCVVCRKGDDDENLLLCDGCDRGCHLYCHRPRMNEVPPGDWFCSICLAQVAEGNYHSDPGSPRRGKKRKGGGGCLYGEEESSPWRRAAPPRQRCSLAVVPSRYSGEGLSPSKRRRVSTRGQSPDLTFCEIILMEMEAHEAAWPFLEPVNPRLVPGYRKVIKNPMDFATMRTQLLRGGYTSCEEFAADAALVFENCRTFNEDESEVGKAGLAMRQFFESRWEEFYQGKHATMTP